MRVIDCHRLPTGWATRVNAATGALAFERLLGGYEVTGPAKADSYARPSLRDRSPKRRRSAKLIPQHSGEAPDSCSQINPLEAEDQLACAEPCEPHVRWSSDAGGESGSMGACGTERSESMLRNKFRPPAEGCLTRSPPSSLQQKSQAEQTAWLFRMV